VPTAEPDSIQAQARKTLSVDAPGVLENDSDPDGDTLTATLAGQPKKGQVNLQPDGSFTYKSNKKAKGTDSFTYLAEDRSGLYALNTVTVQVKGKKHKKGKK
jgi:VCBS repeat-containing protein